MDQQQIGREKGKDTTWRELLASTEPLVLPAAHDALTARLVERAGFKAYQVGGFALDGSHYGFPDIDLTHFGEKSAVIRQTIGASSLPVLVDGDNGYGDVKNVTRTVRGYEAMGASAIFIEDQVSPKSCGQEGKKEVIPAEEMIGKVKAAVAACRVSSTFILIRTDARSAIGLDEAIRRGELYRDAGAHDLYIEGLESAAELEKVGKALAGTPLATTMMEGGGKLPWLSPQEIGSYGFSMILYPTTVLFRMTRAIERALADLHAGRPMPQQEAVDHATFDDIVGKDAWARIEDEFK
ncbi:isocitrate lyase/PEP mutase family protein [Dyella jiangningensis]|nr:isocitrate lyase/PEP mutase family protein [Dyella jiangningensis]